MAHSPYAPTDGPNDHHWFGGGLNPGLADYSPTLAAPKGATADQAIEIREQARAVTLAAAEVERSRLELAAQIAAFEEQKAEKGGKGKKGKKGEDE